MIKKLLTIIVPVVALIAGAFGGDMLRPKPPEAETAELTAEDQDASHAAEVEREVGTDGAPGWLTFPTQFFVPMMRNGDMGGMMIMTLSLETTQGDLQRLAEMELRLRDALLRQLMITANTGGFDGNFTSEGKLKPLRAKLLEVARQAGGDSIKAVLIGDIARQATN